MNTLLLLIVLISGCSKVADPEFRRVGNFRVKSFGLQESLIGINVSFYNPNKFGVTVKEAEVDVYVDSVLLGHFIQDSLVQVNRNSDFTIPFSGNISMQKALKMDLQNISEREVHFRAEGSARVGKAGFFVTRKIDYEGKHKLEDILGNE